MRDAADDDPVAIRSAALHRGFVAYLRWYAARSFHGVRVLRGGAPAPPDGRPLIVYSNHPGWWDPAIYFLLAGALFPGRVGYGPMDADALRQYRIMRRLGVFGIDPGPRGAARFLRVARRMLADPANMLWITAEGAFTDARVRPVALRPGIAHLARTGGAVLLPLALEYTFWNESKPEALAAFGAPVAVGADVPGGAAPGARDVEAWQARLTDGLQTTMDGLAAAAMTRDPARFDTLIAGRTGVGGIYDTGRRLAAWSRLRRFDPSHEA
ncbi:lysophospholipid acyltransferase family protein [Acidisphaera rubrifaciens]|uniref:Phospholipid/glycerol acyltransferase n=1 Tax=Acidisphaera rubrifaciens HS-AP3 TaxID=1231350 RepID=A0A0D6P6P9_9PROT|nr:lysophospholipid acyltransferase family protein [Acidisphaera rubrifaciens]GAN77440.1 phospholipid/glycerol acyltransferase [Acidisphaera rubrifaciens HS-AP3]